MKKRSIALLLTLALVLSLCAVTAAAGEKAEEKAENQNVVLKLVPSDGMPDSDSEISMSAGLFNLSSKESADESDGEVMDIDVFFMKEPPKNDFQGN